MGDKPTNGPYHWGNGPKPKKSSGTGGSKKLMALAIGLIAVPATAFAATVAYVIAGHING